MVEQGLMSHSIQCRSFRRWWLNQHCQSTEGRWLVIQTGLSLTRLTSPCYSTTYMQM